MRKAVIFLNGESPKESVLNRLSLSESFVICADGAYEYVKNLCVPDLLLGDFDSLENIPEDVVTERFPIKKNFTDSQLCVRRAVELGFGELIICGAFGLRPDHEQVNYSLLALADSLGASATLLGECFDVYFVTRKQPFVRRVTEDKTVSLVPYSDSVHIQYTRGLLYEAADVEVNKTDIFTTSNSSLGGVVEYRLFDGSALLFVEN